MIEIIILNGALRPSVDPAITAVDLLNSTRQNPTATTTTTIRREIKRVKKVKRRVRRRIGNQWIRSGTAGADQGPEVMRAP